MARASSANYAHPHDVLTDAEIIWDKISEEQKRENIELGEFERKLYKNI
jgi:hypothetical protein